MKNRILPAFLALLTICMILSLPAGAESAPSVSVGEVTASAGESIEVPIILQNCKQFMNISIVIDYPSDVLTLTNAEIQKICNTTTSRFLSDKPYLFTWTSSSGIAFTGQLAVLTFQVSDTAAPGDYEISVDYYKGRSGNYQDGVNVNYESGGIEGVKPLGLSYRKGTIHISREGILEISAPKEIDGNQYSISLKLDEQFLPKTQQEAEQNFMIVTVYAASGAPVEIQIVPAEEETVIRISSKHEGRLVKFFWLDSGMPVCMNGKTVLNG